ncbi:THO complex subunit mft1 like protein [Verticillium longisporum]|nr:THO complex subunit mft1 like protein [Verticillium longisporum]
MSSWELLNDAEENELHKSRLLNIEEKPLKRITKRLAAISTIIATKAAQQPTPPPDAGTADANAASASTDPGALYRERALLREDLALDFAAFDSSIARLQFLLDANERERARYAADQQRILDECQAVRDNNAALRARLDVARGTLRQRKEFDRLADDITNKSMLRPRDDQRVALQKLEEECAGLERESETYNDTWGERKEQFARIMDEAMRLRRQIRDEKEEVERREGMNEDGEEDGEVSRAGGSRGTTPRPEGDAGTPRPNGTSGGRTPAPESQAEEGHGLKPRPEGLGSLSRGGSLAPSQAGTPRHQVDDDGDDDIEEGEDVEMDDSRQTNAHNSGADTPQITVAAPGGDSMEVDS